MVSIRGMLDDGEGETGSLRHLAKTEKGNDINREIREKGQRKEHWIASSPREDVPRLRH